MKRFAASNTTPCRREHRAFDIFKVPLHISTKFLILFSLVSACSDNGTVVKIDPEDKSYESLVANLEPASNVFVDDRFIYVPLPSGIIEIFDHNYSNVSSLTGAKPVVLSILREGDRLFRLTRDADLETKRTPWRNRHYVSECSLSMLTCKLLYAGDFGVSAIAFFDGELFLAKFEWEDKKFIESNIIYNSSLLSIGDEDEIIVHSLSNRILGIWDLASANNELYLNVGFVEDASGNRSLMPHIFRYSQNSVVPSRLLAISGSGSINTEPSCKAFVIGNRNFLCVDRYIDRGFTRTWFALSTLIEGDWHACSGIGVTSKPFFKNGRLITTDDKYRVINRDFSAYKDEYCLNK